MNYNFDEIIDRKNTNSENVDGWRPYIFKCGPEKVFPYADDEFIRMWVADMEICRRPGNKTGYNRQGRQKDIRIHHSLRSGIL